MGGIKSDAPIDVESGTKKYKLWEVQTHSLVSLLSKKGLLTVDEVRERRMYKSLHLDRHSDVQLHVTAAEERRRGTARPCIRQNELLRALGCICCRNQHGEGHVPASRT